MDFLVQIGYLDYTRSCDDGRQWSETGPAYSVERGIGWAWFTWEMYSWEHMYTCGRVCVYLSLQYKK